MPYGVGPSLPCMQKGRWQVVQGGSGGCCAFGWSRIGEMSVIKGVKEVHKNGRAVVEVWKILCLSFHPQCLTWGWEMCRYLRNLRGPPECIHCSTLSPFLYKSLLSPKHLTVTRKYRWLFLATLLKEPKLLLQHNYKLSYATDAISGSRGLTM